MKKPEVPASFDITEAYAAALAEEGCPRERRGDDEFMLVEEDAQILVARVMRQSEEPKW